MISGIRVLLLATLLLGAGGTAAQTADNASLTSVMHNLASVHSATAHFVEDKYIHALTESLRSEGTLSYTAPDRVEKITTSPEPERLSVEGGQLTVEREGETHTLDLADHPEIQMFVESIRSTLAGDLPGLRQFYTVDFEGTPAKWGIVLRPAEAAVQELVTSIRLSGRNDRLEGIETLQANGDRSEMIVTSIAP